MYKRPTTLALILAIAAMLVLVSIPVSATPELAETEALSCTACHDKPGSKLLTDKGKYFELMGSMDGLEDLEKAFSSCTDCHVKKPGSKKLTRKGKKFNSSIKDMEGLREWLKTAHPQEPTDSPE
jgi:cytochrome c553